MAATAAICSRFRRAPPERAGAQRRPEVKLKRKRAVAAPCADAGKCQAAMRSRMQPSASATPGPLHERCAIVTPRDRATPGEHDMATVTVPARPGFTLSPYSW